MDNQSLQQKQQQFNEFYTIKFPLKVNMLPLPEDHVTPTFDEFCDSMPYAFRIAGEISAIETQALQPLRKLGGHATELVEFLNHQSRKIDLMMSYILQHQDSAENRFDSIEFGGGGIIIKSPTALAEGRHVELKIFLEQEAAAVFCLAEVIACQPQQSGYHITFIFTRIREEDQELLVRASLHLQAAQLRQRAKQQRNEN